MMTNYHPNKEKSCINNEKCYSTDNMSEVSLQNDDKIKLCVCSHSSNDPVKNILLNENSTPNHNDTTTEPN